MVCQKVGLFVLLITFILPNSLELVYFNFKQHQLSPAVYLCDWLVTLFLDHLPFEACARIWDVIILEGDSFLYRTALGILAVLEPRLFFPERKELLELLRCVPSQVISLPFDSVSQSFLAEVRTKQL
jgi:hypothetical protein